jgi:hypothetical protein
MEYYLITYNSSPLGDSGEACRSDFDLTNACDSCGTGAELKGNLKVKGFSKIEKDFFETLSGDFIISKGLYKRIKKSHSQFELIQVTNTKDQLLDYYHFIGKAILPKFCDNSTGYVIEDQCKTCRRNGYFNHAVIGDLNRGIQTAVSALELKYKLDNSEVLRNEFILRTWECLGLSNKIKRDKYVIRYARPWTIVNEIIKDILDTGLIKNIKYEKIKVE